MSATVPRKASALLRDPIPALVRRISLPVITGMFFQTMYNVVDTWAAGQLSTEALAALTASFPVFFLVIAVAHGCQAATNALLSHALGAEDEAGADELTGQAVFFSLWMSAAAGLAGWLAAPALFTLMNVEGDTQVLALRYIRTLFWATPFFALSSTLNGMLSAHGDTRPYRDSVIAGFLLNIVLDIWFVFGGFGLPPMGFAGIARATVLLQALTVCYVWYMARKEGVIDIRRIAHLHPRWRVQRRLMGQGFPALVNMLTIATGIFVYTGFAATVGTDVLAAFGTAMRIEQIALLPSIGLNTSAMTLAGHSLGAERLDRLRETVKTCLRYGGLLYLIGAPLIAGFAPFWMSLFTGDPEVIATGTVILRISMLTYYAFVILFTFTSTLQGLQRPMFAIWMGLYRQIAAPLILIPLLMDRLDPPELGIWWGALAATWSGALLTLAYGARVWRRLKRNM